MSKNSAVFNMEIGGKEYTIEFTRAALKQAEKMGSLNDGSGIFDKLEIILFAGLQKHHGRDFRSVAKVDALLDTALDDGYSLESFSDIVEEYAALFEANFSAAGEEVKKPTRQV